MTPSSLLSPQEASRAARAELARRELERRACLADPKVLLRRMTAEDERTAEGFRLMAPGWEWQEELVDWMHANSRTIALKARQLGVTWVGCGYVAWTALYRPGSLCLIYRQKQEEAFENVGRVWTLLNSLPPHLWNGARVELPARGHDASTEIKLKFPGGKTSRVLAMTSASSSGHGKTAAVSLLDEHSRIEQAADISKAVEPAAGSDGKVIIVSTANGRSNPDTGEGNRFHYIWEHAEEMGYAKKFLAWSLHPKRDQEWYEFAPEVRSLQSHERAEQYPANEFEAFTLTNRVYFDPEDLAYYRDHVAEPLYRASFERVTAQRAALKHRSDGLVHVFAEPVPGHSYAMGADTATGRGRDFSCAGVIDLSNQEHVAEIHGRIDPDLFAYQLHYLGRWYDTALIAPEDAGGWNLPVIAALRDGREGRPPYPKLYRHRLTTRADQQAVKPYGFPMNSKTRPLVLAQLGKAFRERTMPWVSPLLMSEAQSFVHRDKDPSPAAEEGAHDDAVMTWAISHELYRLHGEHPDRRRTEPVRRKRRGLGRRKPSTVVDLGRYPS